VGTGADQRGIADTTSTGSGAGRGRTIPVVARLFFAAALGSLTIVALAPPVEAGTAPSRSTDESSSKWAALLTHSVDLGQSRARSVDVLVDLRTSTRPTTVLTWADRHELTARWLSGLATSVLSGSPAALGRGLGVTVDDFRAPNGQLFYATRQQPQVPTSLRGEVTGIGRISSYGRIVNDYVPDGGLTPSGLMQAYDATPLESQSDQGQGQTIVFFETDGYAKGDLQGFQKAYKTPAFQVSKLGQNSGSGKEAPMDLEVAHEVAPAAKLVYLNILSGVSSQNDAVIFEDAFHLAATRYKGAIWSLSLGVCEADFSPSDLATMNQAVANAELAGTTVFASSGDSGGLECLDDMLANSAVGVQAPASLPAVTGVGGTALSVANDGAYLGETTWTEPLLSQGTGGGQSSVFSRPSFQTGPGTSSFSSVGDPCASTSGCREVPDVAALADPVTPVADFESGHKVPGGNGTSVGAPIWAGFTALIDTYLHRSGTSPVGAANKWLYRLAASPQKYAPFHDITTGGNAVYAATPGYDMASGVGSPDVWNLARDLQSLLGKS